MREKRSVATRVRGWWRAFRTDREALGLRIGLQLAVVDLVNSVGPHLPNRSKPRAVPLRIWGHTVRLRTYSSDLNVARQMLVHEEYGDVPHLPPGAMVVDCGANIGLSALYFLRRFRDLTVVCIEPDPTNFELCRRNLAGWGDQATVINAAVWSTTTKLRTDQGTRGYEWASTVRPATDGEEADTDAVTIDGLLARLDRRHINLLKVDIEGAEREVFSSGTSAWLPRVDHLAIELHGDDAEAAVLSALAGFTYQRVERGDVTVFRDLRPAEPDADPVAAEPMTVVINTYRRPQMVMKVLGATLPQLSADDELLVIDDGSGDETVNVLCTVHDTRLRVLTQSNQGLAAARNRGAREATHDIVVFLDDDTIPHPGLVAAHRRAHREPGERAVVGRPVLLVPDRHGQRALPPGPRVPDMLVTDASLSIRGSTLLRVGGYDEAMRGWEDIDLGLRLQDAGVSLAVADDALVDHDIDRPYRSFRRQREERGRARALGISRHGRDRARAYPPRHPADRALIALAVRNRWFAQAVPAVLWVLVRVGGRVGSWKLQSLAASRAGLIIAGRAETLELRRLGASGTAAGARDP